MSHFLDRLTYFSQPRESFADDHGVTTGEDRTWEDAYRNRWAHDKIVRSTHGVNCTGSCSWKIYVKGGIVTWETQQTDYPRTRWDMPNHEPRGCARGASYSWYLYSANRVKYPMVRGRLLKAWREANAFHFLRDGMPCGTYPCPLLQAAKITEFHCFSLALAAFWVTPLMVTSRTSPFHRVPIASPDVFGRAAERCLPLTIDRSLWRIHFQPIACSPCVLLPCGLTRFAFDEPNACDCSVVGASHIARFFEALSIQTLFAITLQQGYAEVAGRA